jgi:hypothetical protein
MDIESLDRLLEVAADARGSDLQERASLTYTAIAAATAGGDAFKAFESMLLSYAPQEIRQAVEQKKVDEGLRRVQKLLGG